MNILKDLIKIEELQKQLQIIELNHKLGQYTNENDDEAETETEAELNTEKNSNYMKEIEENEGLNELDQEKRSQAFLRFGKRSPAYLRFGRSQAFLRFGKRTPYLRFGKRSPAYLRFGRSVSSNEHSSESDH